MGHFRHAAISWSEWVKELELEGGWGYIGCGGKRGICVLWTKSRRLTERRQDQVGPFGSVLKPPSMLMICERPPILFPAFSS